MAVQSLQYTVVHRVLDLDTFREIYVRFMVFLFMLLDAELRMMGMGGIGNIFMYRMNEESEPLAAHRAITTN
ncbi:hypothetical protein FRX31_015420 [Thalictrum thalictroides]|uniref:Uncharacterized protein n=1 Tax=Thalictrum thalictroides TaxID=46969 RepID=A0A7J6WDE0_THATH|nr:hypothetical protein FRX31_015420 [Thalictrum thalictroides]